MRVVVVLVVIAACGDNSELATPVPDSALSTCPPSGAVPRFASTVHAWLERPCHGYTESAAGVGMAACDDTQRIEVFSPDGSATPAAGLPYPSWPQLSADGRAVTLSLRIGTSDDSEVRLYTENNGSWSFASNIMTGRGLVPSQISFGRHMFVYKQAAYTLVELVENNGTWDERAPMPAPAVVPSFVGKLDLSSDGLRLLSSGAGRTGTAPYILYASRNSVEDAFVDAQQLPDIPASFDRDGFLTDDCSRIYIAGSGPLFWLAAR